MVTYFTDTGYISKELSQLTASVLWIMILSGRTLTAYLSDKIDKKKLLGIMGLGLTVFFTALLFVRNSVSIIIIVMCIGFFASGIFPTSLSFAGELSKRYRLSFSYILTIAGIGAVLMPSIVGYIADIKGIIYGMASVGAAVLLDLICIALLSRSSLYPH
jgi:fucose permease